jgi:hypothetical protein
MIAGNKPFRDHREIKSQDVLQKLVGVFESKGWLNQTLRIRHRDKRYRIFCSRKKFLAYRINDNSHVPHGFPGWPVCIITIDQIIDDSEMSQFPSTEPSARDWLRCINDSDFELI